ncbi:hypothetical protein [Aestuariimicrobium sp. Y1814]|uniref:hypothetical protein n=1 Tax=Aestuariimicrobium sp. Y1814 TaxID=3418742 RepID=UPI003DA78E56
MNTNDLRDMWDQDRPAGLNGTQILRLAHRARARRRLTATGVGAAAVAAVTALAVTLSGGLWNQPDGIAGTPTSPAPTATRVSTLCSPGGMPFDFTDQPGLLTADARGQLVVTSDGPTASVIRGGVTTQVLSLPETQGVMRAYTDGRFVVLVTALTANSGDPGQEVWTWDAEQGGEATRLMTSYDGSWVQVRDGYALISLVEATTGQTTVHLVELANLTQSVVHTGADVTPSLLTGGRYLIAVPGADEVQVVGTGPAPTEPVVMYPPVTTNGSTWTFRDSNDAEGHLMVWSPDMDQPLPLVPNAQAVEDAQVGTNFALVRDLNNPWKLVDLRTGAVILLPSATESGPDTEYQLTVDDVLLRDPMDSRSAGPEPSVQQGWVDLSARTVTC